jgi:lysophospholipid hydrolase
MFDMGVSVVIASDVGSVGIINSSTTNPHACPKLDDNSPRNFGDTVSGWWLMIMRWNPFSNARTIPAITEIQSRLA